ncbi:mannose-1-phosphate guanylyltransferase [Candidatus Shapirobacteria bacterium]|nr:mannose-1-phosphate guanylyltransferase [Candidatus Shapirobacteria bacterium]
MGKASKQIILILCGGTGPRLWPLSRASHPKQFLSFFNHRSLLQDTLNRAQGIVPPKQIFLITNRRYLQKIKSTCHGLIPSNNIIVEPEKKNTAMAIIYATSIISKKFPQCTVTSLPSDHLITNIPKFRNNLKKAHQLAVNSNKIVLIGTKTNNYNPSYGHVVINKNLTVAQFVEKPSLDIFNSLSQEKLYWNNGMYTFSPETLESELLLHQPLYFNLYKQLKLVTKPQKIASSIFSNSENLSIDVAISEKSANLLLVPATFNWSDIGEWKTLFEQLPKKEFGHASIPDTNFISINSQNCLVSGSKNKLIGLVNVSDLAIIDTKDGLLVCHLSNSDHVRDLVAQITANPKTAKYFLKK